ncbi:nuclease inhibitor protein (plasmid) [Rhizobium lusitanum]|uniref:host-nuclease inhibitor Gam family protein n=1 Tax=Rhizobium lusitanum TaxID=293958 RepID=UPI00161ACBF0|nr:host-nuclease inhibitor Gam family protein [Rhizobium lusitanum]QND45227.1 nuclease inhibitor protein [Rhizobium lusitanum]
MAAKAKTKSKAISRVPQSREDAVWSVGRIGTLRRMIAQNQATAEEAVRVAGEKLERDTADLATELAEHERGVQTWCEANRNSLTNDGKVKFHDFGTGQIKWRSRPASVTVRGMETIIEAFKKLGFKDFVRTKEELNKEAMLADPDKARLAAGVTIKSAGEDFEIAPTEMTPPSVTA